MNMILLIFGGIIATVLGLAMYFLPSLLSSKDRHFKKIFFLNLLGSWTGLLWFVALGWALFYKTPKNLENEERERELLNLIRSKDGRVTLVEIAAESKLSLEQAREEIERFCELGHAEVNLTEDGEIVYVLNGFLSDREKSSTKSPLDI
jgi:hypothetical protein